MKLVSLVVLLVHESPGLQNLDLCYRKIKQQLMAALNTIHPIIFPMPVRDVI